jgi:hypothetical protein
MDTVRLVTALEEGFELDAREIAESVWLSRNWGAAAAGPASEPEPAVKQLPPTPSPTPVAPADHEAPDDSMPPSGGPGNVSEQPIRVASRLPSHTPTGAMLFEVPEPSSFPSSAALHRALRPLKRRYPAPHAVVVDEEASAHRFAETGTLSLVLRRAHERWFDVALVVDTAVSMTVWEPAVRDLHRALRQFGGFRDVRRWDLVAGGIVTPGSADVRRPGELVDPTGRRIVVVVTDAAAGMWREAPAREMLERWARSGQLLMVQPLPERLWHRTALPTRRGSFHSLMPGGPTARLRFVERRRVPRVPPPGSVVVPVVEMSAEWLAAWSSSVMATDPAGVALPGARLGAGVSALRPDQGEADPSPTALVERFRATASPAAFRLATYLSATPADFDVMRLVQRTFLPRSGPTDLAEVLLSGLLIRQPGEQLRFDFMAGVRNLLVDDLRVSESRDIMRVVGEYISSRVDGVGAGRTFPAAVDGPGKGQAVAASSEIFAWVAAEVAGRLGARALPAPALRRAPARRALLIGSSAVAAIEVMVNALTRYGFTITYIVRDAANEERIRTELDRLVAETVAGDAVFVYISGPRGIAPLLTGDTPTARMVRFIEASDHSGSSGVFRGITDIELDDALARLTRITRNVTAVLDGRHNGVVGPALGGERAAALQRLAPADGPVTNPDAVHLTYVHTDAEGLFTETLAAVLTESLGQRVNWTSVAERVRHQLAASEPDQHLTAEGPTSRLLFEVTEIDSAVDVPTMAIEDVEGPRSIKAGPPPDSGPMPRITNPGRRKGRSKPRRSALLIAPAKAGVEAVGGALGTHYGFDHIRFHTDDAATRTGIVNAYEQLIAGIGPDDAVVVYLRGRAMPPTQNDTSVLLIADQPPSGAPGETLAIAELDSFHRRLTAATNNVTVIYDVRGMVRGGHAGHPRRVEVYAYSDDEHTAESPELEGLFGQQLAQALTEATGLQISWATLIEQVRRRILRRVPGRRPAVVGPTRRVLFGTAEARNESTLPIVASQRGNVVQILGARLLNVHIGDEFAILATESDESGSQPILGTAIVEGLTQFGAYAQVALLGTATAIPLGARAYRTRAVAERLGVRLPPPGEDLERLYGAVSSSSVLRPSDDDWVYEVRIDDQHRLAIFDRIGPLSDPVSAMSGTGRVFADLERLARATALRRLAEDPAMSMEPVAVDFGRVVDGELLPLDASPLLYAGDAIYVELRNDSEQPVHVSLVDIGVAAEVAVLTRSSPSGIRLNPGDRYVLGSTPFTPDARGMEVAWPAGLAPIGPRPETILVITTEEPHDLGLLEQRGVRAPHRRSPLEQMLAQAAHGTSRATGGYRDIRSGAYAIRAITFNVAPGTRPVDIPEDWPAPGSIMSAEELRSLTARFRRGEIECDVDLVAKIVSDVAEYNAYARAVPGPTPPPPLDELLRLMGWLLYEVTWEAVQRVPATLDAKVTTADELRRGLLAVDHISALADVARRLPWPEFAPRALGAIRAQALAESKRDTETGYDVAWTVHQEARRRDDEYRNSLSTNGPHERYLRDLDEVLLQLALAETGTACRMAERVISRWSEDFADEVEDRWLERIFGTLSAGADIGEVAIDTARQIQRRYGFVDGVTEDRLALHSAPQNPGIMTARASALMLALGPAMQRIGLRPETFPTWEHWEAHELARFAKAYQAIEASVLVGGRPVPIHPRVMRQLIHMRLNLALLKPGIHLSSALSSDPVLEMADLDDAALNALSARLAPADGGPGRERGLGAVMMPAVIRSIRACRGRGPDDRSYDRWRIDWFRLDQFSNEDGRRTRLEEALAASR